jgi:hypothetical protein
MDKTFPRLKSDEEIEALLEDDLSDYLTPDNFKPVTFEFKPYSWFSVFEEYRLQEFILDILLKVRKFRKNFLPIVIIAKQKQEI